VLVVGKIYMSKFLIPDVLYNDLLLDQHQNLILIVVGQHLVLHWAHQLNVKWMKMVIVKRFYVLIVMAI
jgi:hypothetical protein